MGALCVCPDPSIFETDISFNASFQKKYHSVKSNKNNLNEEENLLIRKSLNNRRRDFLQSEIVQNEEIHFKGSNTLHQTYDASMISIGECKEQLTNSF